MLRIALACLIIALIAGLIGFGDIATGAAALAQILFVIFLIVAAVFVLGAILRKPPPPRL